MKGVFNRDVERFIYSAIGGKDPLMPLSESNFVEIGGEKVLI